MEVLAFGDGIGPDRFGPGEEWANDWKDDQEVPFPDTRGSVLGDELVSLARSETRQATGRQRTVVTMRDILGFGRPGRRDAGHHAGNQRVLLRTVAGPRFGGTRGLPGRRIVMTSEISESMNCDELVALATAYLEGPRRPWARLDLHLVECGG